MITPELQQRDTIICVSLESLKAIFSEVKKLVKIRGMLIGALAVLLLRRGSTASNARIGVLAVLLRRGCRLLCPAGGSRGSPDEG